MKHIKRFNESEENLNSEISSKLNENGEFGIVNIQIDGEGFIKNRIVNDIRQLLSKYQGERHLFVDGEEVKPYKNGGGMG
jgi:hypothetical protein